MHLTRRAVTLGALASAAIGRAQASRPAASRLIVFFTPNGTVPARWRPTGTETAFTFGPGTALEPLTALREQLVVIDELDFFGADNHEGGMAAMLTGTEGSTGESAGMSLDQFVAARLPAAASTRFRSLELGVATSAWGSSRQTRMAYAGPGRLVSPDDDPAAVARRVFNQGAAMGSDRLTRKQAVLRLNKAQLARVRGLVPASEHEKVDGHVRALSTLEARLAAPTGQCGAPAIPMGLRPSQNDAFPQVGALQMDLLVAALACDATRVASLQWSHTVSPIVPTWLSLSEAHHELSHMSDSNRAGVDRFIAAERWFTEQFASFLRKLQATPDPAGGGTLFDTSLVLWCKEMGDSRAHVCRSVPMVLSGRANGALRLGRYLKVAGEPHQKLLVSLCHLMGLDNETFGDAARSRGPLAGLA
ncbi:MAG: DUF1552 domain-containing protein [Myxococcaceae bacterium]|jgi:hypothetical protein|nr:DUF1552 domain-containing protein [Myxococcaceae bacterium]